MLQGWLCLAIYLPAGMYLTKLRSLCTECRTVTVRGRGTALAGSVRSSLLDAVALEARVCKACERR